MAQAARLNLRLQKELKLLLTDPPPGASFPFLSADSDLSSLSTIHAQIEGPEGTVYAKGVFEIKIQIPERYPFQPPNVTIATPIYHPNIDNGGRICLDILNLPPKGAWQPSLNISTVLTSIGLLLSEPNPDDGLMCEVSREYKYNRQAFDLKARSVTEKYAKTGVAGNGCITQGTQSLKSSVPEFGGSQESGLQVNEIVITRKKLCGISQKLSLESSSSTLSRGNDVELNEMEAKGKRKQVDINNLRQERLCGTRRKLSLESSCQIQKRNGHEKENVVANQSSVTPPTISIDYSGSSVLQHNISNQQKHYLHDTSESMIGSLSMSSEQPCQLNQKKASFDTSPTSVGNNKKMLTESQVLLFHSHSNALHGTSSMAQPVNSNELQPHKDFHNRMGNASTDTCTRTFSVGKKLSLGSSGSLQGQEQDNKENVALIHKMPVSSTKSSCRNSGIGRKLSLGPLTKLQGNNDNSQWIPPSENLSMDGMSLSLRKDHGGKEKQSNLDHDAKCTGENEQQKAEGSPIPEAVVLDSEDSEEEMGGALRAKLSLTRKRRGYRRAKT